MYAVIRTGGKQYRVAPGDIIAVEKLAGEKGEAVTFGDVLMLGDDKGQTVGSPTIAGAAVSAEVVDQTRGDKITVFKFKRRKGYRRTKGHRQDLTVVRITDVGGKGAKKAPAKKAAAPKAEAKAPEPKAETETEAPKTEAEAAAKPAAKKAPAKKAPVKKATTGTKAAAAKKPAAKKAPAKKPAAKADDAGETKE